MANEKINKASCFLKYLLTFLCFILLLMAAGIFVQTLIFKSELKSYNICLEKLYTKPVMFLLVGSVILEFVALLGVVSTLKNFQPGIIIFCMCLVYLLVSMLALTAITYVLSTSAEDVVYSQLKNYINNYSLNQKVVDELQKKLKCCGLDNFNDWRNLTDEIPGSCCDFVGPCDAVYVPGCFESLKKLIKSYEKILVFVLIILGIIEIFSILFSCHLARVLNGINGGKLSDCQSDPVGTVKLPRINNPLGEMTITRPQKKQTTIPEPVFLRYSSELPRSLAGEKRQSTSPQKETRYKYLKRVSLSNNSQKLNTINCHVDYFG